MAEETIIRLIDDIDGGDATQKVVLGLNGEWRALDLNDKNHAALLKAVDKFWDAGQPVRGRQQAPQQRRTRGAAKPKQERNYDLSMLREWAAEKDVKIPTRGRIAGTTIEQFQKDLEAGWQPRAAQ